MEKKKQWMDILLCGILCLLPFLHVNIGIGIADQGYNLANFESFPHMNQMWMIATLVANLVGKFLTVLPFGHTMLGMNIYCTMLLSVVTAVMYFILRKDYCRFGVFAGLLIAVCFSWAPKVTLYQYLSYYLFCLGAVLLVQGLHKNKRGLLFAAGVVLGINLFVRFPNALQAALIVVVFFHAVINKRKIKEMLTDTVMCIAGYLAVVFPAILIIELCFGKGAYMGMINSLFSMTDSATAYSPFSMFYAMYNSYATNLKWFAGFLLLAVVGVVIYGFLRKKTLKIAFYAVLGILFLCILRVYWYYGVLNTDYMTYHSVYVWGVCLLFLGIVTLGLSLFSKRITQEQKLYSVAALVIIFISPLGSNNALYSNFNNLYLVAPVLLGTLISLWKTGEHNNKDATKVKKKKILQFSWKPYVAVGAMLSVVVMLQTFIFHGFFVFGDVGMDGSSKVSVGNNEILAGMKTTETNAFMLEELTAYIRENFGEEEEYIVWGRSPLLFYALDLECAIGHTWPSLDSYPYEELQADLNALEMYPIVIYEAQYYENLLETSPEWDKKSPLITGLLQDGQYGEVFRNDYYVICVPDVEK